MYDDPDSTALDAYIESSLADKSEWNSNRCTGCVMCVPTHDSSAAIEARLDKMDENSRKIAAISLSRYNALEICPRGQEEELARQRKFFHIMLHRPTLNEMLAGASVSMPTSTQGLKQDRIRPDLGNITGSRGDMDLSKHPSSPPAPRSIPMARSIPAPSNDASGFESVKAGAMEAGVLRDKDGPSDDSPSTDRLSCEGEDNKSEEVKTGLLAFGFKRTPSPSQSKESSTNLWSPDFRDISPSDVHSFSFTTPSHMISRSTPTESTRSSHIPGAQQLKHDMLAQERDGEATSVPPRPPRRVWTVPPGDASTQPALKTWAGQTDSSWSPGTDSRPTIPLPRGRKDSRETGPVIGPSDVPLPDSPQPPNDESVSDVVSHSGASASPSTITHPDQILSAKVAMKRKRVRDPK